MQIWFYVSWNKYITEGVEFFLKKKKQVKHHDAPNQQLVQQFVLANNKKVLGAVSIRKTVLPGMAIPMLKIRRPNGRLIFNMEIAIRR